MTAAATLDLRSLTTAPDGDIRFPHVRCEYGRCRTKRGLPRRTLHIVRDVLVDGVPFAEANCTSCRQITYINLATGDVFDGGRRP